MTFERTETREIKKALVAKFECPFSVTRGRGTAHHWIGISWEDGPTDQLVRQFCCQFNDTKQDDIMTDLWCGSQYTNESREFSLAAYLWAVRQIEAEYTVELQVTITDSWRGGKTAYITNAQDQILENDSNDYSNRYASNKVNRLLHRTDLRGVDLGSDPRHPDNEPAPTAPPEKTKEIIVTVEGGVIQDVLNIPEGVKVTVRDFDTDGCDPKLLETVEGHPCCVSIWKSGEFTTEDL